MYAYNLLREPLLANLCQLLAQIVERSAAEQVRWQVCISISILTKINYFILFISYGIVISDQATNLVASVTD